MRAIDADALFREMEKTAWYNNADRDEVAEELILNAPTIEPERKKGRWLYKERREPIYDISGVKTWGIAYMCSECEFIHTVIEDFGQYVYCPNCGAEMTEDSK